MNPDVLQTIRDLQFTDKSKAEALLLSFLKQYIDLDVIAVELRTLAISLNSFNGFMTLADGRRYFFKTHTETDTVIDEYYNAGLLYEADYPVIQPVFGSNVVGKQILIYEIIEDPSVFDVARQIENGDDTLFEPLKSAQISEDLSLFQRYESSLEWQHAEEASKSPIHQLFYHRIAGGRLKRFYGILPDQTSDIAINLGDNNYTFESLRSLHWTINGQSYAESLDTIIAKAAHILNPAKSGASILGHGDAHNGNVFLHKIDAEASLLYFDPAFAGRHHPLLDLVKPIFHNVFAMWMYFPQEKNSSTSVKMDMLAGEAIVEYTYPLHAVRSMFLESKLNNVLLPLLQLLKSRDMLSADWRSYFKSALFCCPFLTMNLADPEKFPASISLLGLCMSIEMGAESKGNLSMIDQYLNDIELRLADL